MEKRITPRKLQLSKKTIVRLQESHLSRAFGGTETTNNTTQSKQDNTCNPASTAKQCEPTSTQTNKLPFPFPTR
jgi:hypothetical protein